MLYVSYYDSPIGKITLGAREDVLVGAWFEGQKYYMDKIIEDFEEKKDLPVLDQAEYWLDRYFAGQDPDPEELPLAPAGSDFRKEVWKIIAKIPYGCTITYGKIAKILAVKRGAKSISPQAFPPRRPGAPRQPVKILQQPPCFSRRHPHIGFKC